MLSLKQKLHSQRGASMLMAMIFLLFCLLIGGSVLAAATANSSRIEHMVNDQQDYLLQRSSLAVMADMLTPQTGNTLQILFKADDSQVDVDIPATNFKNGNIPAIQQVLLDIVIDHVLTEYYGEDYDITYSFSNWTPSLTRENSGSIQINLGDETLNALYSVSFTNENGIEKTCILEIKFDETEDDVVSHVRLVMTGNINHSGNDITIGWSLPSIQK